MFFDWGLAIALVAFGVGVIHRIDTWLLEHAGIGDRNIAVMERMKAVVGGARRVLSTRRILLLVKVLIVDILLQFNILKEKRDPLAWVMHILIFCGFVGLLLVHVLGKTVTLYMDPGYQSTLNPYLFLRNAFGGAMAIGIVLAVIRRAVIMRDGITTRFEDIFVLAILVLIIVSGFLLESLKITSHDVFIDMVEDYAVDPEPEEITALTAYWVAYYGLVAPAPPKTYSAELLAQGAELNEASCMECHSRPQAAFASYTLSRLLKPAALGLDRIGARTFFWVVHIIASFVGLAYMAYGKMFHVIATPISLLIAACTDAWQNPAGNAVRQVIERDGCSHGGACHDGCPVRLRRFERIERAAPFSPIMIFLDGKTSEDLGGRKMSHERTM